MMFWRRRPAAQSVTMNRGSGDSFHAIGRVPRRRSKPTVVVEHDDRSASLLLDFAIGESGCEQVILTVTTLGMFTLPVLSKNVLVSVRARDLPVGEVTITVAWAAGSSQRI